MIYLFMSFTFWLQLRAVSALIRSIKNKFPVMHAAIIKTRPVWLWSIALCLISVDVYKAFQLFNLGLTTGVYYGFKYNTKAN